MQQPCPTTQHQNSSSQPQTSHLSNSPPLPLRTHSPHAHALLVDTQSAASLTQVPTPALSATATPAPIPPLVSSNITDTSGQSFTHQDQGRAGTPSALIVAAAAAKTPASTTTPAGSVQPTLFCETCMAAKSNVPQQPSSHHSRCDVSPSVLAPPPTAAAAPEEFDIVQHPVKDTLLIVSSLLSLMVHNNDSKYNPLVDPITLFHSRAVPRISIEAYLARILQYIPFTNEVLLNVLVFLDRIGGLSGMEMNASGNVEARQANGLQERADGLFGNTVASRSSATMVASSLALAPTSIPCSSRTSSPRSSTGVSASASYIVSNSANVSPPLRSSSIHSPPQPPRPSSSTTTPSSLAHVSSSSSLYESSSKNSSDPDSSNNNHNNSTYPNSNSDLPMIQKRGREEENLETKEVVGTNVFDHQQQEQQSSKQRHQPPFTNSIPQSSNPLQSQQHAVEEADLQRALKRTKLEATPSSTSSSAATSAAQHVQPSATIDAQRTPGGYTPAPTPQLAVASNGFRINSFNIHRLLITCLMVAAKFTSDLFYSNARYAKVGGLSLLELNQLELEFLFTTRFELNVRVEELQRVGNALLRFKAREMTPAQQRPAPEQRHHQHQQELLSQVQPQQQTSSTVAINSQHGNVINTATAAAAAPSGGSQTLQQKAVRFSIPSPTSPRSGPMSDRSAPTPTSSSCSSSTSSTSSSAFSASTTIATLTSAAASASSSSTVVVLSGARSQRPQLLSPPEEKHSWAETDVQMTEERIDQDQRPSTSTPSRAAESAPCSNPSSSSSSTSPS